MALCTYLDILDTIWSADKSYILHFKLSKSGQILRVDKTCFPRPGHILFHNLEFTACSDEYCGSTQHRMLLWQNTAKSYFT